jgi:DNA ligase-1
MESVIDILEALESDNSRLFKEEVLRKNRSNDLLKRVFVAAGDPYTNFFVNKFKMPPPCGVGDDDEILENFLEEIYEKLSTRSVTGNAAKDLVVRLFTDMTGPQQKWCLRILLRNLRVGASESLVEKTWPGAIAKFSVQLAESLESRHEPGKGIVIAEPVEYPVRVEPKLDGLRCIAVKHNGAVTMFTRSGSPIETLPTIKAALEAASWDNFVLDGEAMGRDWNESASVVMSHKTAKDDSGMVYNVFDAMVFDDWKDQANDADLLSRVDLVKELVEGVGSDHVVHVGGITAKDQDQLLKFYGKCIEGGYEGIMVKKLASPYIFKRSDSVLKLKPVTTYEGVIVGHYEGNRGSKREGLWGGFLVVMPNGVVTKVGGGYNDKIRAEISIDPDSWIGKIIEVEGQPDPLTADGLTADGKVRFPVFIRERDPRDVDPKVIAAGEAYRASI